MKSRRLSINIEKQSEIIAKFTTNYYNSKKLTIKITKKVEFSQSTIMYKIKNWVKKSKTYIKIKLYISIKKDIKNLLFYIKIRL